MHGLELSKVRLKEIASQMAKTLSTAPEYDFTIPANQYAVFYSEPLSDSKLTVQMYVYSSNALVGTFTVVQSFPYLAEVANTAGVPEPCRLTAATEPKGNNGGPYTPVQSITVNDSGSGVLISVATGETDATGQPVVQTVYMEIKVHP